MSKRADTTGLDPYLVINRTKRSNREQQAAPAPPPAAEPLPVPEETPPQAPPVQEPAPVTEAMPPAQEAVTEEGQARETKEPSKRRRGQAAGYKETYLKRNEMKTRQCVYISYDVHAVIAKLVRVLVNAGNDISVGGYIDTVLNEHLQAHREEINEVYRQQQGDLL